MKRTNQTTADESFVEVYISWIPFRVSEYVLVPYRIDEE